MWLDQPLCCGLGSRATSVAAMVVLLAVPAYLMVGFTPLFYGYYGWMALITNLSCYFGLTLPAACFLLLATFGPGIASPHACCGYAISTQFICGLCAARFVVITPPRVAQRFQRAIGCPYRDTRVCQFCAVLDTHVNDATRTDGTALPLLPRLRRCAA